ncbi:glycine betaine/proline transport system substrate-binding protein [Cohaesibacter sp. ES.047]|uniref:glycine betaine/L-proline ABC transporter substrate-binding protein ProX n=1 Tax=Cohaesibacter sp. ES.047 TaxID=1798205 RepID=UPI000BB7F2D5|nr:glycine betaine/L-proline ABC transporter substrate-binding protein ProX [Cohaesibacter sp. ES.047]SNY90415.1 glycine betaine/proline transport system substrate-binding protein [Cohaesibacter sp. ES.047]
MANAIRKFAAAAALSGAVMIGAAPSFAADMPGEGVTIKMGQATWDTGWFHSEIYSQLFQKLGYAVDGPTTLDVPVFYQSVAFGDLDLWVNGWFPLHDTYKPAFEDTASIVGAVAPKGALQGYLVDKAAVDKFDIKSLEDFKRPEVKEAFDRNGDGKADMVACPPGWGCEMAIAKHMEDYDLGDDVNLIKAGYSASMADAVASYEAGEHILFYTWTPNWTVNQLKPGKDVMWITVPERDGVETAPAVKGLDTCVSDPCSMGFAATDILPVANDAFIEKNPAVKTLLEEVRIPVQDIYAQNAAMNEGDDDVKAQASAWIEKNQDEVNKWLDDARAAAK